MAYPAHRCVAYATLPGWRTLHTGVQRRPPCLCFFKICKIKIATDPNESSVIGWRTLHTGVQRTPPCLCFFKICKIKIATDPNESSVLGWRTLHTWSREPCVPLRTSEEKTGKTRLSVAYAGYATRICTFSRTSLCGPPMYHGLVIRLLCSDGIRISLPPSMASHGARAMLSTDREPAPATGLHGPSGKPALIFPQGCTGPAGNPL